MKDKILKLLGQGLSPGVVASAVGCDASYISQLMTEDDFALEVAKLRCENLEEASTRDKKYDSIEDRLLEKLENVLPFMLKPRDILDAISRINAAKRRGANPLTNTDLHQKTTIINLQLPAITLQHFTLNERHEVIEVGKRALVNMPASALMKSLEERSATSNASQKTNELPDLSKQPEPLKLSTKQAARAVLSEDSV